MQNIDCFDIQAGLIYGLCVGLVNWQDVDPVETGRNAGHHLMPVTAA